VRDGSSGACGRQSAAGPRRGRLKRPRVADGDPICGYEFLTSGKSYMTACDAHLLLDCQNLHLVAFTDGLSTLRWASQLMRRSNDGSRWTAR
jgi:hypothetical protein